MNKEDDSVRVITANGDLLIPISKKREKEIIFIIYLSGNDEKEFEIISRFSMN